MRRSALFGLLATVLVASAAPAFSQSATPASAPAAQPFRKLEFSRIGGWEIAAIGNDEKVNHCILTRGTSSADPKPGEPKFAFAVDQTWAILQLRTADFKYTEKKGLPVTVTTAEGSESKPLAATGGPDLANIRFATPTELNPVLATKHLDVRVEDYDRAALACGPRRGQGRVRSMHGEHRQPGEGLEQGRVRSDSQAGEARHRQVHDQQAHERDHVRHGLARLHSGARGDAVRARPSHIPPPSGSG